MATPMLDPAHPLADLLRRDVRYDFDAYVFVFDALKYAQEEMGYGVAVDDDGQIADAGEADDREAGEDDPPRERHVTGQELCEAMRQYSLQQYGLLARCVLDHWGIRSTSDFGEIVFNLIEIGQMRKTDQDRREDFDEVFPFDELLEGTVFDKSDVPNDAGDLD